jgi:integrase
MVRDPSENNSTTTSETYQENRKQISDDGFAGPDRRDREQMVRAELMGKHSHAAADGTLVHVWKRGAKYLARGSLSGLRFGETIGETVPQAEARLRQILADLDHGAYIRPSEQRKRLLSGGKPCRLTLRQLANEFLAEKRKLRGRQTASDYKARLAPVLDFAERPDNRKRWPLALDLDRDFALALRPYLFQYLTTRNGRAGGRPKSLSQRQVYNVLQCLRTMLSWASSAQVRKLPAGWANPLTDDLLEPRQRKDPLREDKLPLDVRVRLVGVMDSWQMCQLAPSLVLPMRPGEAAGLLVSDVDFERGLLVFGHGRFADSNFTKEQTPFKLPFPEELRPLLRTCVQGRAQGPLLRSRRAFGNPRRATVASSDELERLFEDLLARQPGQEVQSAHDRKRLFRRLLARLGGVSEDAMNKEFKALLARLGVRNGATFYTLRASVTTAMSDANLPILYLRYLTSHSTGDILNEYASLDPVRVIQPYFDSIRPLLEAIAERCRLLGLA